MHTQMCLIKIFIYGSIFLNNFRLCVFQLKNRPNRRFINKKNKIFTFDSIFFSIPNNKNDAVLLQQFI